MMNYYAQAIDIIWNHLSLSDKILIEVAKMNPSVIVKAYDKLTGASEWERGAKDLVTSGLKVQAIKYCREQTGMGLKEAKEAVEKL